MKNLGHLAPSRQRKPLLQASRSVITKPRICRKHKAITLHFEAGPSHARALRLMSARANSDFNEYQQLLGILVSHIVRQMYLPGLSSRIFSPNRRSFDALPASRKE